MAAADKSCHGGNYHLVGRVDLLEQDGVGIRKCINCGRWLCGPFNYVKSEPRGFSSWTNPKDLP